MKKKTISEWSVVVIMHDPELLSKPEILPFIPTLLCDRQPRTQSYPVSSHGNLIRKQTFLE